MSTPEIDSQGQSHRLIAAIRGSLMLLLGIAATQGLALVSLAAAQVPTASAALTGFWQLRYDSRNVPTASLLPGITVEQVADHTRDDAHAIRWCQEVGTPAMMDSTAPLDILQGRRELAIASQMPSAPRHIYLDRTQRPDPQTYENQANGFSIGHWEGQTLVVETEGFSDAGITSLPGGGFRTATSHLTERYRLVDQGRILEVTFTWTDPHVFARPHTYAFRYYRVPRTFNAGESFCDPGNQDRADFLTRNLEPSNP